MTNTPKFAVFGGGSWATAIVKMLSENLDEVGWYMRSSYVLKHLQKEQHNPNYLSSVEFDINKLKLSNDINQMIAYADYLIFVIPSAFLENELKKVTESLENKVIFSGSKGVIPESHLVISDHLNKFFDISYENLGILSGPTHAEEIANSKLSYLTIGSSNKNMCDFLSNVLSSSYIKTSISEDIVGIEYAAALKNIYSILVGISIGLNYGDNFISVLISHCTKEMINFIKSIDNIKRDFSHSAYIGDLLVTTYSNHSRNRTFGKMIGEGLSVNDAISKMSMVVEGYYATKNAFEISKNNKESFYIIDTVFDILYNNKNPKEEISSLSKKLD